MRRGPSQGSVLTCRSNAANVGLGSKASTSLWGSAIIFAMRFNTDVDGVRRPRSTSERYVAVIVASRAT